MSADGRWFRVADLFDGALELSPSERDDWLDARTRDDPSLAEEVRELLEAYRREDGVLDRPPVPRGDAQEAGEAEGKEPGGAMLESRLADALDGRYRIHRRIGAGGMSVVFLAWEPKHGREVVLKVLRPELTELYGTERFRREVSLAARLSHPHILGLIDSGEADGLLYYVMPHVEGETLKDRLERQGSLPLQDACALLRDVAGALDHAHRAGVVHRDLKPGNVLCVGSHAFLFDFGVAKAPAGLREDGTLTRTGHAVGTPRYMAPEQREDPGGVDQRADLYAWGLLAFEMLTTWVRPPHGGSEDRSPREIAAKLRAVRPDLPASLAEVVGRCLAPDPEDRPPHAGEIVEALDGIGGSSGPGGATSRLRLAAMVLLVLAGGAGVLALGRGGDAGAEPGVRVAQPVAVAPFANETGDSTFTVLGRLAGDLVTQGLHEAGITEVVPWPVALDAAERRGGSDRTDGGEDVISALAAGAGAGSVVTGAIYLLSGELRFRAEVVDVREGRVLGALEARPVPRDSAQAGILDLRDRLLGILAVSSDRRLSEIPGLHRRPPTYEAYRAFDRGLELYLAQEYGRASERFLRAFELDTTFAPALLYAATTLYNERRFVSADSLLRRLEARREQLTDFEDLRWEYLVAQLAGDGPRALRAARQAASLAPHSRSSYDLAVVALSMNRPREALRALERIDPDRGTLDGWAQYWTQLTLALHLLGEHGREVDAAREMRRRYPERRVATVFIVRGLAATGLTREIDSVLRTESVRPPDVYWSQGAAMVVAGEELLVHDDTLAAHRYLERAVAWLRDRLESNPGHRAHRYWLGSALYDAGHWTEARDVFVALARDFPDRWGYRGMAAVTEARLGNREEAMRLLEDPPAREAGTHLLHRARVEALLGRTEDAIALLGEALERGVDGWPWFHATAHRDLEDLRDEPAYHRLVQGHDPASPPPDPS